MKKLFSLFALCAFMLFVSACMPTEAGNKIQKAIEQNFAEVNLANVKEDLTFVNKIDGVSITYQSSNEKVLASTGKVTLPEEDTIVTLRVTYTYESTSKVKIYEVVVKSLNGQTISSLKEENVERAVNVKGIVAKIINGTEKNVPVGFYLVDKTDAIYVYASTLETMPNVGDEVKVNGNYVVYLSESDKSSASYVGYAGARQITLNNLEVLSSGNEVNYDFAKETSIAELAKIDVKENITSNLYYVTAKVRKAQGNGFVNYYFDDLNGVNSYYAYTTSNGKDLGWLEQYDGTIRRCLISVANAKISASGSFWRIIPIEIGEEITVTDEEYANYAMDRVLSQFQAKYQTSCEFNLKATDEFTNATISYTSTSNGCTITKNENDYSINISFTSPCQMEVEVTLTYKETTVKKVINFECIEEVPGVETKNIVDARLLTKGENVNIKGIIAGFLYLKGATKPAGFELVDETSSIAVFVSTSVDTNTDITKLSVGEFVIVNGDYDLYQPREDNNHKGSIRLNNAEVLYHDYQKHDLYEGVIETVDFETLYSNPSDNNITNKAYYSTFYIERTTGSYVNYYIHDLVNPSHSMIVYSQNSGQNGPGEYEWLKQYAGKCVKAMMTLRIGAVSNKMFVWKAGVLDVVEVVETPSTIAEYFVMGEIKSLFATEYASATTLTYNESEAVRVEFKSTSNQVEFKYENGVHTINIKEPVLTEIVNVEVTLKSGDNESKTTLTFQITKAEAITIAEFRNQAKKGGENVVVEGIVSSLVKYNNDKTWTFFVTDATGTILCKTKADVNVGDMVRIQGNMDLYYGLPQISTNAIITVLSTGNTVDQTSFNQNATIADLVNNNTLGEAGKCGGMVYTNVKATIHVSNSRVYISVGNQEIDLYMYTNASYYEAAYKPLEAYDGQEITLDLVAYSWYQSQYTYVVMGYNA